MAYGLRIKKKQATCKILIRFFVCLTNFSSKKKGKRNWEPNNEKKKQQKNETRIKLYRNQSKLME